VADALTTAFMLLDAEQIEDLCDRSPGLQAWVLPEANDGRPEESGLLHFGGLRASG
jgi:thiamine biosynthesis lipoprotein ApbE